MSISPFISPCGRALSSFGKIRMGLRVRIGLLNLGDGWTVRMAR